MLDWSGLITGPLPCTLSSLSTRIREHMWDGRFQVNVQFLLIIRNFYQSRQLEIYSLKNELYISPKYYYWRIWVSESIRIVMHAEPEPRPVRDSREYSFITNQRMVQVNFATSQYFFKELSYSSFPCRTRMNFRYNDKISTHPRPFSWGHSGCYMQVSWQTSPGLTIPRLAKQYRLVPVRGVVNKYRFHDFGEFQPANLFISKQEKSFFEETLVFFDLLETWQHWIGSLWLWALSQDQNISLLFSNRTE